jgi:hypothetical protein
MLILAAKSAPVTKVFKGSVVFAADCLNSSPNSFHPIIIFVISSLLSYVVTGFANRGARTKHCVIAFVFMFHHRGTTAGGHSCAVKRLNAVGLGYVGPASGAFPHHVQG